ncbi:MAG: hypothetical protein Fur0032_22410 [Terrimicrobiaceae bacterium]
MQDVAHALGYRCNPYVSALMQHLRSGRQLSHQGTIAILDTLPDQGLWRQIGVQRHFHKGAEWRANELGFTIERHWCPKGDSSAVSALNRILQARGIHGVLIPPVFEQAERPVRLPLEYDAFCCVTVGHRMTEPAFCFALNDQFNTAQTAHSCLRQRGYRRIGLAIPAHTNGITNQLFRQGFAVAENPARPSAVERAILIYQEKAANTKARFCAWMDAYRPDAVLLFNPELLTWIRETGRRVPQDLGVAFLDLDWDIEGLSGMDQNSSLVGAFAAELLVQMVYRNHTGPSSHPHGMLVEGFWRDGSTAPPRKAQPKATR